MSIALEAKVAQLEERIAMLERRLAIGDLPLLNENFLSIVERIQVLEQTAARKPGPKPKDNASQ